MAYKQKGFTAHDNMKTRPKDLSGRTSINQRTPQIKPGDSPSKAHLRRRKSPAKLRWAPDANYTQGLDQAWNTGSNISQAMSNQAGAAASNIAHMQQTSGFVNNPGHVDYNKNQTRKPQRVFGAMETGLGPRQAVSAGITRDASEVAAKSRGSIQDMINQTISNVQSTQDAKRAAALNKYKADLAKKRAATKSAYDASIASWKSKFQQSEAKQKATKAAHDKMIAAQKAAAAKAKAARRRRGNVVNKTVGTVGKVVGGVVGGVGKAASSVVKGVTKTAGGIVKSVGRGISRLFGFGRRRRRRRSSKPKTTTPKTTTTTTKKKVTPKKKAPVKRRRRRRRRRWWSDMRLKQNIMLIGSSKSGIPIYNFNYIGDNNIYQGAMAQDLISMGYNNAVIIDNKSGYYMVDYDQIDVDMIKI